MTQAQTNSVTTNAPAIKPPLVKAPTLSQADYHAFIVSQIAQRNSLYETYYKQAIALGRKERERIELRLPKDNSILPQIQRLNRCMEILRQQTFELRQREFLTR